MTDQLSDAERDALGHWSLYGQPGEAPSTRWIPSDDERARLNPIRSPRSAPLAFHLDAASTTVLLNGVGWREMEDKWIVWSDEPGKDGAFAVHLDRSWTGNETLVAEARLAADGSSQLIRLTWETDPERIKTEMDLAAAWKTFVEVCRWSLGTPID